MNQRNNQPLINTLKWSAGILATVISGVVIFWLTEGLRASKPTQPVSQTSPVEQSNPQQSEPETPVISGTQSERELDGIWDISIIGNRRISSDGFIEEATGTINRVWRLSFTDNIVTGEMLGSKGTALQNPCNNATLSGERSEENIQLTLTFNGSCCPEEQSLYLLTLEPSSDIFRGTMKPQDVPEGGCTLWYGDLVGEKRTD
ncbi:hypothetical protein S7335_478 [Synechococcus sp. PCC 7335]|uniref:hypothetical protein n=1 Tax=Synechococcus sp. (strain ATCC 29403 / PCC 7335) TaxID=91464 RepID=UPI00017EB8DB|nr:hypothetical protein [Synechococcus sp. PCC 7335]EDX82946.1 hypothetical protein S7335_124 [Synechococcus sp. PCC 7335]EDX83298.1 hypothetical protein S7335_478 [Synechococcus sp. PCC 7335]